MKSAIIYFVAISVFAVIHSCSNETGLNCHNLSGSSYDSYKEALQAIKSKTYIIADSVNVLNARFVDFARYYSCDGAVGYFIVSYLDRLENCLGRVPIAIWKEFKKNDNKEMYYDKNIKPNYRGAILTEHVIGTRGNKYFVE